jgi:hypothetical protein
MGGSVGTTVAATWAFPSLITTGTSGLTFPTYASHLLGKQITEPFPTDLACASVVNSGSTDATVHLSLSLGAYAVAATVDVSVSPQSMKKTCLTPSFAKTALYALTAPDTATLTATAKDSGGSDVGSVSTSIAIPPVDDIAWSANGIDGKTLKEMAAVYVEPNALDIDKLQRLALQYSAFGIWDSGHGPYQRDPYTRSTDVPAGTLSSELFIIDSTEGGIAWAIGTVTCSVCLDTTVDVAVFTPDQYDAFVAGTDNTATAVWPSQTDGATSSTALSPGVYYISILNSGTLVDRTVTWTRTVTHEDVVRDVLLAVFSALGRVPVRVEIEDGAFSRVFSTPGTTPGRTGGMRPWRNVPGTCAS